jgi:hypothetical protein
MQYIYTTLKTIYTICSSLFSTKKNRCRPKVLGSTIQAKNHSRYITQSVREEVLERQRDENGSLVCAACLLPIVGGVGHFSHLDAFSLGGDNSSANLLYCCPPCNLEVGTNHPAVYYARKGDMSKMFRILAYDVPKKSRCEDLYTKYQIKRTCNVRETLIAVCRHVAKDDSIPKSMLKSSRKK